ncbi:MAG: cbb3-type cytochrome c oxidase subunit I [Aureliella sp.]
MSVHAAAANGLAGWLGTYIFARDHKVIGLQFLFSTLIWFFVGGMLAMAIRWQLAWPWQSMPIVGPMLFSQEGGQISPEFYTSLVTQHATVMVFFVIIPIFTAAFGNYLIPLMIGAEDMAFPTLSMMSYWMMWPAFIFVGASFFVAPYGAGALVASSPGSGTAQTLWLAGILCVGIASMMGSLNCLTTIIQMRAPGMTMFRLPMTVWAIFITAILQAFALPVLAAGSIVHLTDRVLGTGSYLPELASASSSVSASGGGQSLLWQHLFSFYSHPAVYILILPAMGMVSDVITTFSRKPLFGYRSMVIAISTIAGLGLVVWGHHMYTSWMSPVLGITFAVSTVAIVIPSAVKVFGWLGTLWGGRLVLATPMLFAIGFVSMFIVGGLSGILMASTPVDMVIHDTYYIVAHFHYVLVGAATMGIFAGLYFWFPKMFGRQMSEFWGRAHFALTFVFINGTFFPMYLLGAGNMPRRYADPYHFDLFADMQPLNKFITFCAFATMASQAVFVLNFLTSIFFGRRVGRNPWNSNTLEWAAASPPGQGNYDFQPVVHRGPYEYSDPRRPVDFCPQNEPAVNALASVGEETPDGY